MLIDALHEIEVESDKKFFYASEWMDTLNISLDATDLGLEELLDQIFKDTKIDYVIFPKDIVLTYNTPIIQELPHDSKPDQTEELVYIYTKEYVTQLDDPEIRTYEIGEKIQLRKGGNARLAGYVRDIESGGPIIGAVVYIKNTNISSIADEDGFYSINLPRGLNEISIQSTGMKQTTRNVMLYSDGSLSIDMIPEVIMLDDVLLQAERDVNINSVQMGVSRFRIDEMKNVPKILGENDIIQVALSLPGVKSVGEGAVGINVRGGKVDQNLMLLNQSVIYNPYHFFGFFSSFNADVISEGELYKSSIPANLGGRLSSVFDVKVKHGEKQKFSAQGGISPVTTRLTVEIPLVEQKTSLVVGARATYSDWVLNFVDDPVIQNSDPFFIDGVVGLDHQFNEKNDIHITGYYSYDRYKLTIDSLFDYSNAAASAIWNHRFNDKLNGEFSINYSSYSFGLDFDREETNAFSYGFDVQEMGLKATFSYQYNNHHRFVFGGESKYYQLNPGFVLPKTDSSQAEQQILDTEQGLESALYFGDDWSVSDRLTLNAGLRFSIFNAMGPATAKYYEEGLPKHPSSVVESNDVANNEIYHTYSGPEFRISARYALTTFSALKISLNRMRQYIQMLSNNVSIAPTDTWKLSDNNIKPQISDQYSIGYYQNFSGHVYEASLEGYYKKFDGLLDFKTGADLVLNDVIEREVLQGDGYAYGVEFLLKKKSGKLNGWIGYTYSRSYQRFTSDFPEETINNGDYFSTNYDQPHDFSVVSNYRFTRRYSLSLNVKYTTGRPITYPSGKYFLSDSEIVQYSDRNRFRIPDYFRVDIGLNIEGSHKLKKLAHGFWTLSVYNLLGRDNVYAVYFVPENGEIVGKQLSIFAVPIPTITYNFKF